MQQIVKRIYHQLFKRKQVTAASKYISDLISKNGGYSSLCQYHILNVFPHDSKAYTQGIVFDQGHLYESTGLMKRSTLRHVHLPSGKVIKKHLLASEHFAEGITVLYEKIYQLTWQSRIGFVYDRQSFKKLSQFSYPNEGWGLTHDGTFLIMSEGTSTLRFYNPDDFKLAKDINVHYANNPVGFVNELQFVNGVLLANIWHSDYIAIICAETGHIKGWIDLSGLRNGLGFCSKAEVLNGIAYNSEKGTIYVTGKFWPKLFELKIPFNRCFKKSC